ncbi:protein lin-28 homolog A [Gadus morhua]|uniref:Lin-28 homolog Ab n=1 Tax=Gadus morhua TaxID=8049 RepID=A0A8C5FMA8_GADMO|nr:protein lin-28 homolog A-like [Gadus morhua]
MEEGGRAQTEEEDASGSEEGALQVSHGSGACKWFNVRMGFGFLSMTTRDGTPLDEPVDVFVHQSKLHMEGFRSLKEGEAVEFSFKKSSKGLESLQVSGPNGGPCLGSDRRPKGAQKRRSRGERCYNCGEPDHHAKECQLPPQPKKCHFCQSFAHMVASCPLRAQPALAGPQGAGAPQSGAPAQEEPPGQEPDTEGYD